jgi:hypothetical protein
MTDLKHLSEICTRLRSDDISLQSAAMAELHSSEIPDLDLDLAATSGLLSQLTFMLHSPSSNTLHFDVARAFADIALQKRRAAECVVECGAVNPLVHCLRSPDDSPLRNQAACALINIISSSPQSRGAVLAAGVLDPLLAIILGAPPSPYTPVDCKVIHLLCKCCHIRMSLDDVARVLPALLPNLARRENPRRDTVVEVCVALAVLSDADPENQRIQLMLDAGVAPLLVNVLRAHRQFDILSPAVACAGSLLSGDERQTQIMIDAGVVGAFKRLLQTDSCNSLRKSVCWALANITGGDEQQIQAVMDAKIVPILVKMFEGKRVIADVEREISWVLANAAQCGSSAQIGALIDCLVLQRLLSMLILRYNDVVEEHVLLGVVQCVTVADRAALQRLRLDYRSDIVADFLQSIDKCRNLGTEAGDKAADTLAKALFVIERARMAEICMAMQALDLPALVTVKVLEFTVAELVKFHKRWEVAVKVKHFPPTKEAIMKQVKSDS